MDVEDLFFFNGVCDSSGRSRKNGSTSSCQLLYKYLLAAQFLLGNQQLGLCPILLVLLVKQL